MTEAVYRVVQCLESFIMPVVMYRFLNSMFLPRSDRREYQWGKILISMAVVRYINSFNNPVLNLCGVMAVLVPAAVWMFCISFGQAPLYVSYFVILMVYVELVAIYLGTIFGLVRGGAYLERALLLAMEIIVKILVIEVVKKQVRGMDAEREHSYMGFLALFSAAVFGLLMSGVYPESGAGRENVFITLSGIFFILANIAGFSVEEKMMEAARNQQTGRLMDQKARLEEFHYKRMEELTREYGEYIHELEHSLRAIRQLWENDREAAAHSLAASADSLERHFQRKLYLSDPIVNAILTEKERTGREQGLRYHVEVAPGLNLDFIQDIDKISIFGNLLDNGAEAAVQTENGFVNVSLYMGNKALVVFVVENSCRPSIREHRGSYLTTKQDKKSHGFGLKKVRELALKYNGILELRQEEGIFVSTLILSSNVPRKP